MQKKILALCLVALGGLSACGDTYLEKGLLGAGAGAGAAMLVGGDVEAGALLGAAGNIAYCEKYPSKCN